MFQTNQELYEPTVMFFGMCNSSATFQAMMDKIFKKEIEGDLIIVYMDNVLGVTIFLLSYLPDTRFTNLCIPSPLLFHITYALPPPSPSYVFYSLHAAFSYLYFYTLPSP